jgi:hypothetical protein
MCCKEAVFCFDWVPLLVICHSVTHKVLLVNKVKRINIFFLSCWCRIYLWLWEVTLEYLLGSWGELQDLSDIKWVIQRIHCSDGYSFL